MLHSMAKKNIINGAVNDYSSNVEDKFRLQQLNSQQLQALVFSTNVVVVVSDEEPSVAWCSRATASAPADRDLECAACHVLSVLASPHS